MARPRSIARPLTKAVFDPPSGTGPLPVALRELLDAGDPAIPAITKHVLCARMVGKDVTNPEVIARCIDAGRADYAADLLDGVA